MRQQAPFYFGRPPADALRHTNRPQKKAPLGGAFLTYPAVLPKPCSSTSPEPSLAAGGPRCSMEPNRVQSALRNEADLPASGRKTGRSLLRALA